MDRCIIFQYTGKYAHFLKAEANASAPSYPFPSRTILLGLVGAVLGLPKDSPQILLKNANFAVSGSSETTHWHTANFRKDPPAALDYKIKKSAKGTSKAQRNTFITQEWLFKPNFTIYAQLPNEYQSDFEKRLKNREWYFSPSLGLSEMMADLKYINTVYLELLKDYIHKINTVVRKSQVELNMEKAIDENAVIKSIRMPRDVSANRTFTHETYFYEVKGNPLSVKTVNAYKAENKIIAWL
jgi:CRISPR-associated protein Cas5h